MYDLPSVEKQYIIRIICFAFKEFLKKTGMHDPPLSMIRLSQVLYQAHNYLWTTYYRGDSYLYNVIQIKTLSVRKSPACGGLSPIWGNRTWMAVTLLHRNLRILIL